MALEIIAQLIPFVGMIAGIAVLGIYTKGDMDNGR